MDKMTLNEIEDLINRLDQESSIEVQRDEFGNVYKTDETKREAAKALRQLLAERQPRPMEDAPRDGTPILLWAQDYFDPAPHTPHYVVGKWCKRVGAWETEIGMIEEGVTDDPEDYNGPSDWLPLPSHTEK